MSKREPTKNQKAAANATLVSVGVATGGFALWAIEAVLGASAMWGVILFVAGWCCLFVYFRMGWEPWNKPHMFTPEPPTGRCVFCGEASRLAGKHV